jgi:hypothetical protein
MIENPYFQVNTRHLSPFTILERVSACARIAPDMRKLFMHERLQPLWKEITRLGLPESGSFEG